MDFGTILETIRHIDGRASFLLGSCLLVWILSVWLTWRVEKQLGQTCLLLSVVVSPLTIVLICYDMRVREQLATVERKVDAMDREHQIGRSVTRIAKVHPTLEAAANEVLDRCLEDLDSLTRGTRALADEGAYFIALAECLSALKAGDKVLDVVQPFNPKRPLENPALKKYMTTIATATQQGVRYELFVRVSEEANQELVRGAIDSFRGIGVTVHLLSNTETRNSTDNFCLFQGASSASLCMAERRNDAKIVRGSHSVDADRIQDAVDLIGLYRNRIDTTFAPTVVVPAASGLSSQ